jgi:phenylalanyl-tRNA synthetase beta chain
LIVETCGGELAEGVIDVGTQPQPRPPIVLRLSQLKRIIGIDIPTDVVERILTSLGLAALAPERGEGPGVRGFRPPSWRRDLEREIDLIEEAARIYGYDKIPEDVSVPMVPSARTDEDRVAAKVRGVLTACGYDEALTISVVDEQLSAAFSPWTDAAPLALQMPILERADRLRRSLIPSLLKARRDNEAVGNRTIELFETAKVYLPRPGQLPQEDLMLGLTSGRDFFDVKGTLEAIVAALDPAATLEVRSKSFDLFTPGRGCEVLFRGEVVGVLGEVSGPSRRKFDLRGPTVVAEVKLIPLVKGTVLVPRYVPLCAYPAIDRDLNLVVDEAVRWADVAATVRSAGGELLASFDLSGEPFRDEKKLGTGKKSFVVALVLQSRERTLTGGEADDVCKRIVDACMKNHGATLRA